jgi:hypothetical protein
MAGPSRAPARRGWKHAAVAVVLVVVFGAWGCGQILGIHDLPPQTDAGGDLGAPAGTGGGGAGSGGATGRGGVGPGGGGGGATGGSATGGSAAAGGTAGAGGRGGTGGTGTGSAGTGGGPTCTDGQQNGNEQGIDCGGICPKVCLGAACIPTGSPCARGACWGGICRLCGAVDLCTCEVEPTTNRLYMKCYDEGRRKSWSAARQACVNEGLILASIGGPQENAYVVSTHGSAGDFWVGGSSTGSTWVWTDGTAVGGAGFTNWDIGQPVLTNGCMAVAMGSQKWISADCTLPKDFLCEEN